MLQQTIRKVSPYREDLCLPRYYKVELDNLKTFFYFVISDAAKPLSALATAILLT